MVSSERFVEASLTGGAWLVCQQGAREHYAVARAAGAGLVTDVWAGPRSPLRLLGRRLAGRHHADLSGRRVTHFNHHFLLFDAVQRLRRRPAHEFHAARNALFDRLAARQVAAVARRGSERPAVFAYSYSCRDTLRTARDLGCLAVLGQFDPGPVESDIVERELSVHPEFRVEQGRYPDDYFARWREEVAAADVVAVNSPWSGRCLEQAGVPADKLRVVPLVYEPAEVARTPRQVPDSFTRSRPLRVLFLGQVILRKGVARLLAAADALAGEPIVFELVGPTDITNLGALLEGRRNVRWHGAVARSAVDAHYAAADVFVLPTLSDGFALTQLEALARGLPVVVTRECGEVVRDGANGLLLPDAGAESIAAALRRLLDERGLLASLAANADARGFGLSRLREALSAMVAG